MLILLQAIYEGRPVIVCCETWGHWAVCAGVLGFGKRVVCIDSGDNDLVRLRTLDEVVEHPLFAQRSRFVEMPVGESGKTIRQPASPLPFSPRS